MSWGFDEEQFFYRGWDLADVPEGFSFVVALCTPDGEVGVVRDLGEDRVIAIADGLRADAAARKRLADELRRSYWWVRNRRWCGGQERVEEAEVFILTSVQLLELAGIAPRDIVMMCQCGSHKCVCDGCDCSDGRRAMAEPLSVEAMCQSLSGRPVFSGLEMG